MSGKRHHFIPQFLQRGFASHSTTKDYYTWVYRKGDVNPFNTNIKNTGVEGYFYSEDKESTLDDIITDAETEFGKFVDELRFNDDIQKIDNKVAARLIAHLEIRTKNIRDSFRNVGTLLLDEMTNFLQDQENCERFVKKQIALEAGKMVEEELRKVNIPRTLLPIYRQKIVPLISEKIPEMTENMRNLMRCISLNTSTFMEKSAKSGHIKALLNTHTPPIKVSEYEKLSYQVLSTRDFKIPLGDSGVIFNIEGEQAFKPYCDKDNNLLAVVLPISSTRILVGTAIKCSINIREIPKAIAACSLEYFICSEDSIENQILTEHISRSAKLVNDIELEQILNDFIMEVQ